MYYIMLMVYIQMDITVLRHILHLRYELPEINIFKDVMSCKPVDIYQHFR
jgi:hypothetical protein